jgi:HK97 gp10 family phage protein
MADTISLNLTGDFEAALDRLAAAAGESALRAAGVAGAKLFQEEAQARVPVKTGRVKKNIIIKRAEEKSDGNKRQTYLVLVRGGSGNYGNTKLNRRKNRVGKSYDTDGDAFYWRFLEFGTSKMAARPFMRPAYEARRARAIDVMRARLWEKILEELGKA